MTDVRESWVPRLNGLLFPWIGPPPLGPYDEAELLPVFEKACPLCGQVMSAHWIEERDGRPTKLHCPVDTLQSA